jgi:hypothetical protein
MTPITRACQTAGAHIYTKTMAGATLDEWRACLHDLDVRGREVELQIAITSGHLTAVQAVLQEMNKAYRQALQQRRGQAA